MTLKFSFFRPTKFVISNAFGIWQFSSRLSPAMVLVVWVCLLGVTIFTPARLVAQGGNARTVTLTSGLKYEGRVFDVPKVAAAEFQREFAQANLIFAIDDGLRRVFVSKRNVLPNFGESDQGSEIEFNIFQRTVNGIEGNGGFLKAGPFDRFGHRNLMVSVMSGKSRQAKTYVQGITKITPRYCVLDSLVGEKKAPRNFSMRVSLRNVPTNTIMGLVLNEIPDKTDPAAFYELAQFFQQAKDYTEAGNVLRMVEDMFPAEKERIRDAREELRQYEANQVIGEVRNRILVGQRELGLNLSNSYLKNAQTGLGGELLAQFQDIQDEQKQIDVRLDETRTKIFEQIDAIRNLDQDEVAAVKRFASELESELNIHNVARLDAFLLAGGNATPKMTMALAISGWLMGTNRTDDRLPVVADLFEVRDLVLEFLADNTPPLRRSEILNRLKQIEGATPRNIEAIVKQLKSVEAEDQQMADYDGSEPIQFNVQIPGPKASPEIQN
ncbi:MAG: hypothetical protein AAF939_20330, partial [Planctomycetota bacterium]